MRYRAASLSVIDTSNLVLSHDKDILRVRNAGADC